MNVFGVGLPEMILIGVVALLVFGPKKLPEIGRTLGKTLKGFQDASREFQSEFQREAEQLQKTVIEPMKATLEDKPALSAAAQPIAEPRVETSSGSEADSLNVPIEVKSEPVDTVESPTDPAPAEAKESSTEGIAV